MSTRVTRSMSASSEQAPMQSSTTTRGKLRGGRKPTRGRKSMAAAGRLALVREGESNAAAGQPILVGGGEIVENGALVEEGEGTVGESSSIAGPQDGHQVSLPRPSTCSNRLPLLWLTFVLALAAVLLAFFAPPVFSRHQSANMASSLAEFGNELQRLTNQMNLLAGRVGRIEERATAAEAPAPSQINWLSWDLGARAINRLTTPAMPPFIPTTVANPWWCLWCKKRHFSIRSTWYEKRLFSGIGPDAALLPHSEHEPPYCTSGSMQLAVKLPRLITPTALIIEHWRKDEVTTAGVTPRDVELWVEDGEKLVLAGKWIYNIHAIQEAQKFPVALGDLAVQRVAVRIASNWGNSNTTCLVRAKLHGIDKSGIKERLIEE